MTTGREDTMGQYDGIKPDRLRADLKRFAELLLRLEEEDALLTSPSDLLTIIGELRQKLFAYEVRCSHLLGSGESSSASGKSATQSSSEGSSDGSREGSPSSSETEAESRRIVREARERHDQMIREWSDRPDGDNDDGG
ncbi:MAG: hypothetical protein EA351_14240 [Gemmatimonadales bacterium]|nr:MAG: hypothetical protein EA351_14240 [Gemmatimonadales bacterium]